MEKYVLHLSLNACAILSHAHFHTSGPSAATWQGAHIALGVSRFVTRMWEGDAFPWHCLSCLACCHWALGDSGEEGHVSLQGHVAGFVLCRLVSWIHPHPEQDRQGSCERHVKASGLLPWQTEPGGTLQPALEGNNHERDNGLFWVNRSWQPNFPWWK